MAFAQTCVSSLHHVHYYPSSCVAYEELCRTDVARCNNLPHTRGFRFTWAYQDLAELSKLVEELYGPCSSAMTHSVMRQQILHSCSLHREGSSVNASFEQGNGPQQDRNAGGWDFCGIGGSCIPVSERVRMMLTRPEVTDTGDTVSHVAGSMTMTDRHVDCCKTNDHTEHIFWFTGHVTCSLRPLKIPQQYVVE